MKQMASQLTVWSSYASSSWSSPRPFNAAETTALVILVITHPKVRPDGVGSEPSFLLVLLPIPLAWPSEDSTVTTVIFITLNAREMIPSSFFNLKGRVPPYSLTCFFQAS